jgi:hypothetical protein
MLYTHINVNTTVIKTTSDERSLETSQKQFFARYRTPLDRLVEFFHTVLTLQMINQMRGIYGYSDSYQTAQDTLHGGLYAVHIRQYRTHCMEVYMRSISGSTGHTARRFICGPYQAVQDTLHGGLYAVHIR